MENRNPKTCAVIAKLDAVTVDKLMNDLDPAQQRFAEYLLACDCESCSEVKRAYSDWLEKTTAEAPQAKETSTSGRNEAQQEEYVRYLAEEMRRTPRLPYGDN